MTQLYVLSTLLNSVMTFFLLVSLLILHHPHPPSTYSDRADCYNSNLSQLHNKHAPLKSKIIRTKSRNPWYYQALEKL